MTCEEIERSDVMEQYLLGRLSPAARDDFDQHLFECDECFERLQTFRALRRELAATADVRRAEPERATRGWIWKWALVPTFAVLVIAVSVSLWPRVRQPMVPTPETSTGQPDGGAATRPLAQGAPATLTLAELGRIEPPPFTPGSLRGIQDDAGARFREGMGHYSRGDYRGAVAGLRAAARLDPEAAHATFFLGICYVLTGQLDEGIRALRQTIAAGDSPYLEEAHFYLAKAFLLNNDPTAARQELERTIRLQGPLAERARQLLADMDGLATRQP